MFAWALAYGKPRLHTQKELTLDFASLISLAIYSSLGAYSAPRESHIIPASGLPATGAHNVLSLALAAGQGPPAASARK